MSIKRLMKRWEFIIPAAIAGLALFAALGGWAVALLWNWLLPPLFGFRTVTVWQALGLLALTRILFGGLGVGGSGPSPSKKMSRKEREQIRQRMCEESDGTPDSPSGQ